VTAGLFGLPADRAALARLTGTTAQVAGIRPVVLDDGPERGVRALLCETGGGLAFSVLVDRALGLGTASFWGTPLAWQAPVGFRHPGLHDPHGDDGRGFMRSMSGLLVTCGLDHIRQPKGSRPLHGLVPFAPARLLRAAVDWGSSALVIEGEVVQWRLGAEHLILRRTIRAPLGRALIEVVDEVANEGPAPSPAALLYHLNLGFPAIGPGTVVTLDGERLHGPLELPAEGGPHVICRRSPAAAEAAVAVTTPLAGAPFPRLAVTLRYATAAFPWFQCWLEPTPGTCALGLEPCTSERMPDGTSGPEPVLEPGERRRHPWSLELAAG
jgi:hypothetical protein